MVNTHKTISYAIMVHNEHKELKALLTKINQHITMYDEIIVLVDKFNTTTEVYDVLHLFNINYKKRSLNGNFAAQKNYLLSLCTKDYIFNIDSDEIPSTFLFENLNKILTKNPTADILIVPRINIVTGITMQYVKQMNWVYKDNKINWPDPQQRIIKNHQNIIWQGKVHERLTNYKNYLYLPFEEQYAIIHKKTFSKQKKQNALYDSLDN